MLERRGIVKCRQAATVEQTTIKREEQKSKKRKAKKTSRTGTMLGYGVNMMTNIRRSC